MNAIYGNLYKRKQRSGSPRGVFEILAFPGFQKVFLEGKKEKEKETGFFFFFPF